VKVPAFHFVRGALLSDDWTQLLTRHIANGKTTRERDILPSTLAIYEIKKELELSDGSKFWKTLIETVIPKRKLFWFGEAPV
jgi:hypothetical protein